MSGDRPAEPGGTNGHWVKLGEVSVDSATLGISDPAFVHGEDNSLTLSGQETGTWGSGIQFWSGLGDGFYDVWGWMVDCGSHERIAQVVITLFTQDELDDFRA